MVIPGDNGALFGYATLAAVVAAALPPPTDPFEYGCPPLGRLGSDPVCIGAGFRFPEG